jgi:hypothetical protein
MVPKGSSETNVFKGSSMSRPFSEIVEEVKTLPTDEKEVLQSLLEKYLVEERRAEIYRNYQASLTEIEENRLERITRARLRA